MQRVFSHLDRQAFLGLLLVDIERFDSDTVFGEIYSYMGDVLTDSQLQQLSSIIDDTKYTIEQYLYEYIPFAKRDQHYALHAWLDQDQALIGSVEPVYQLFEPEHWSQRV